jgi:hypothetical protein
VSRLDFARFGIVRLRAFCCRFLTLGYFSTTDGRKSIARAFLCSSILSLLNTHEADGAQIALSFVIPTMIQQLAYRPDVSRLSWHHAKTGPLFAVADPLKLHILKISAGADNQAGVFTIHDNKSSPCWNSQTPGIVTSPVHTIREKDDTPGRARSFVKLSKMSQSFTRYIRISADWRDIFRGYFWTGEEIN